jgi:DNA-binding MltR family transcriptional regulator
MPKHLPDALNSEGMKSYVDEIAEQTDRACAVVSAALLDTVLERLLRKRLVEGTANALFRTDGPLATFAAKISMARALGLLTTKEAEDLHLIRKIRNKFAHSLHARFFTEQSIRMLVENLEHRTAVQIS